MNINFNLIKLYLFDLSNLNFNKIKNTLKDVHLYIGNKNLDKTKNSNSHPKYENFFILSFTPMKHKYFENIFTHTPALEDTIRENMRRKTGAAQIN